MVQGLAFLSKKSWHTKNLSNQSKVWQAEQQKEAEDSKTKELARQIAQEREQEELDRISGKKTTIDRGIDWMYQGGTTGDLAKEDAARKAEEFLLGKEYVGAEKEGINNILNSKPMASSVASSGNQMQEGALESGNSRYEDDGPSVKDRNESFRLRVEDPMFAVTQQQREKVLKAEKKKALYEKVVGPAGTASDSDEHSYGEMKKRSKEDRKKRKKKKRSRRDEDDDRKRRRRSRSRSNERRRKHHRRDRSDSPRRHEYHDDSRSDYKDRKRSQHKEEKWDSRERKGREDERSARRYSEDDERRSRRADNRAYADDTRSSRNDHNYGAPSEKHRDHDRSRSGTRGSHDHDCDGDGRVDGSNQKYSATGSTRYGLQGGSKVPVSASNLGPDKDLLRKKREEKEAERRRVLETASSRRHVSSSDRAKALEEMKADAKRRDDAMTRNASRRPNNDSHEKAPARGRATFLHDMTKQTHGIDDGGMSLSARVAQNRHTNQRSHDSFL